MVTALPYECMLVNSQRPGLEYFKYARVEFPHSVDVHGCIAGIAIGALQARGVSSRSGMLSFAGGQDGCGTLTLAPIMQFHKYITMYRG